MENRVEKVREYVDSVIKKLPDEESRRYAYIHLYGVAQASVMIAMKRHENVELAAIAAMLHDIYAYAVMDTVDHARKGAVMARAILEETGMFKEEEIRRIFSAIFHHSEKDRIHSSFDDVLVDADVMQHCLYNPLYSVGSHERERFEQLKKEFGLG